MHFFGFTSVVIVAFCCAAVQGDGEDSRPNILIILADDLGYSDLGCYGGEIRTPRLDALATNGLRFTQCYNSSRCCPTRASLLTGLYPHQAGIGRFVGNGKLPGYRGRLNERCVTLAEVLGDAGYNAYACGKWHVNDPGPIGRGFDAFYGFVHGYAVDSWDEKMMIRLPADRPKRSYADGAYFATDAITDHALDFMKQAIGKDQPWLLYVAYQVPHFPVQAPTKLRDTYVETYRKGWDVVRFARLERMKTLGLMPRDLPLSPREQIDNVRVAKRIGSMTEDGRNPAWSSLDAARREDLAMRMAVYAAMVENMDSNIGRLVDSLRDQGELDNTLILFTSDNGACAEWEPFGFDLDATDYAENQPGHGIRGSTPGKPNILHTGEQLETMGGPGSLFSYGCGWANVSNTPLRLYKHYAHEGGIRAPLIAHWPAGIRDRGVWRNHVVHVIDFMATCVDVAGTEYPEQRNGNAIQPMEGRSLRAAFAGQPDEPRTLIFEHERNAALRDGNWKIVASNIIRRDGLAASATWELYNLRDDPVEQNDLAPRHPQVVQDLAVRFLEEAERTKIFPAP